VPKLRGTYYSSGNSSMLSRQPIHIRKPNGRITFIQPPDYIDTAGFFADYGKSQAEKRSFKFSNYIVQKSRLQFKSFFRYKTWPPIGTGATLSDHSSNIKHASPHISVQLAAETPHVSDQIENGENEALTPSPQARLADSNTRLASSSLSSLPPPPALVDLSSTRKSFK